MWQCISAVIINTSKIHIASLVMCLDQEFCFISLLYYSFLPTKVYLFSPLSPTKVYRFFLFQSLE